MEIKIKNRDLKREYKNIKIQEKQSVERIRIILASLNEAYAESVAISIEKQELLELLLKEKEED